MADKWFSDISAPGRLTLPDLCDQIEQKIHLNADNQKPPQEFSDCSRVSQIGMPPSRS